MGSVDTRTITRVGKDSVVIMTRSISHSWCFMCVPCTTVEILSIFTREGLKLEYCC